MARILLFGADGMLGWALARTLARGHVVTAPDRARYDIMAQDWSELPAGRHDYVLNAAGVTPRRTVAAPELWTVNAAFPHAMAATCARAGARLIHVSTDCVFDGRGAPHDEAAAPTATDDYGRSKAAGEPALALTLRTSIVGPERRAFQQLLCWCLRQPMVDGYVDHRWNGVTTLALAESVRRIIEHDLFVPGVRHVHAEDTTKFALVETTRRAFGHDGEVRPVAGPLPRDMRLATRDPGFLAALRLPPLAAQVAALVPLATPLGAWRDA